MYPATAAGTASITHVDWLVYSFEPTPTAEVIDASRAQSHLPDISLEDALYAPSPITPAWVDDVVRAIRKSVARSPREAVGSGRWLSQDVVNAATDFFQNTADLLPGEPFIYSSREGDLVAEFEARHGTMTSIVSSAFVLLFAVVDGVPVERRILDQRGIREEVEHLTGWLSSGHDGNLEASK